MNASSWKKAADIVTKMTPASLQASATATVELQKYTEAEARVGVLSISEEEPVAGEISRIMLAPINISTTHMTSNWNSMAHHVVCVEDSIITPSIVTKGNMISITLWKR